ncbi:MAG: HAMP domain-containing histidine kinase [Lachnospiraceae bacterium]|nr:HAMP domain-containing histidine kinase [Lachnospiraceae bacterium]
MKSNYERNQFTIKYSLVSIICLLVCVGFVWWQHGELTWKDGSVVLLFAICLIVIYIITYRRLNHVYTEVETISEMMSEMMEGKEELPEEQYKEGAVGVLYTNFYKVVGILQENRNRELNEKIFLRDIISDISHQLKTPLASLNVFVDLLLEDKIADEAKRKQILSEAANQLSRMEWMVLSMLKLARIEAGAIQFDKKKVSLKPILMQAAEGVQFLVQKRNQTLLVDCDEDVMMLCDGEWLTEALINLLKNASDYSGEGKRIWIGVEHTNVYTRIYVKDEGVGIAESELPNIFKRFYRVHQEVNPNSVGIGLSLTKSIIEGMDGMIRVQSEEGAYTWFVLTFVK